MTQPREPGPDKAHWHYQRAGTYRDLAQELLERSRTVPERAEVLADAAGALLYEAAKQCVNAVANLHGRDPQDNRAKMNEINTILAEDFTSFNLIDGSSAAWELHIHADQGNLLSEHFSERFTLAAAFIDEMQAIFRSIAVPA